MAFKELVHRILERIKNDHTFSGWVRWEGTHLGGIIACIASITERRSIPLNNVECLRIIWSNLSRQDI